MKFSTAVAAVALAAASFGLTACGGSTADTAKDSLASLNLLGGTAKQHNAPPNTGDFFKGPPTAPPAMDWVQLSVGAANGLSPIVHDGAGRTLYRFDKDSANPPKSNCNDACEDTWPAVTVKAGGKIFFNGISKNAIGVLKRDDGRLQVTLNGQALYRFSKDTGAGQTNGEGVGGTWFASDPKGGRVLPVGGGSGQSAAPSPTDAASAPPASGGDSQLGNGSVILDSGKNFTEPNGSVGESGPGCKTLGAPFTALSVQLDGGPVKFWKGPNCTGESKVITSSVNDLEAFGFSGPVASIRFGG